jgi:glycosyltransferase involved in cell wall biosynthesis
MQIIEDRIHSFSGRLAVQQRVIPAYRLAFFDLLAESCKGGFALFAGHPLPVESIPTADHFETAQFNLTQNRHFRDPQSRFYLCWQDGIASWLDSQDPDVLIVEANPRYLSTYRAISWMKKKKRPVLGWGLGVSQGGNPLDRFFRQYFLKSMDGLIAYSKRGAEAYRSMGLDPIYVAHNAVLPRPKQVPKNRDHKIETPTVLFVGRLQKRKGIDILLRGCAALPVVLQPKLMIVGDGPVRPDLEVLARQIYPQTEFTGAIHGEALTRYFETADLFTLPGTGGLAVQEAMTHGLPVIVAQGDGTQDDLVHPENGWQVPPGDQTAFNNTLKYALSDIKRLRQMGMESYRIVAEEINLEAMVKSFVMAIHDVMDKSRK